MTGLVARDNEYRSLLERMALAHEELNDAEREYTLARDRFRVAQANVRELKRQVYNYGKETEEQET